jgi:hypothetical protein
VQHWQFVRNGDKKAAGKPWGGLWVRGFPSPRQKASISTTIRKWYVFYEYFLFENGIAPINAF